MKSTGLNHFFDSSSDIQNYCHYKIFDEENCHNFLEPNEDLSFDEEDSFGLSIKNIEPYFTKSKHPQPELTNIFQQELKCSFSAPIHEFTKCSREEQYNYNSSIEESQINLQKLQSIDFFQEEKRYDQVPKKKYSKKKINSTDKVKIRAKRKNYPSHLTRAACKAYIDSANNKIVRTVQNKIGIHDFEAAKRFVEQRMNGSGFGMIMNLMNYKNGNEDQKSYKKAFVAFQRIYFRKCHIINLMRKSDTNDKEGYIEDKSRLIYLPSLTSNGSNKLQCIRESPLQKKLLLRVQDSDI